MTQIELEAVVNEARNELTKVMLTHLGNWGKIPAIEKSADQAVKSTVDLDARLDNAEKNIKDLLFSIQNIHIALAGILDAVKPKSLKDKILSIFK